MYLPQLILFLVVACSGIAVCEDIKSQVYQNLCADDRGFRDGMIKCFSNLSRTDQLIFQICGSALANDTTDDYNVIIDDMCEDVSFTMRVCFCIDHLHHLLQHFNDSHDHRHHHDHPHHHHHDDESQDSDDGSNDDEDESHSDDDESHEDDHHDHHGHHGHHNHNHKSKHGIHTQDCFKNLYAAYNITGSTPVEE